MREIIISAFALVTLVAPVLAQDSGRHDEARGPGRRGHGPPLRRLIERLNERLDFDDQQMARIAPIVAAHEQEMQKVRAQWEEMRAAMEAGDEARATELRAQLRQQHGEPGRRVEAIFEEIEPLLYEDQIQAFRQFREELAQRREHRGGGGRMQKMLRGLPEAVNMTEDQRREFEELLAKRREMMHEGRGEHRRRYGPVPATLSTVTSRLDDCPCD